MMKYKKEAQCGCNRNEDNQIGHENRSFKDYLRNKKDRHQLESTFIYMQNILEELRVAGEDTLIWMKRELQRLLGDTASKQIAEDHYAC